MNWYAVVTLGSYFDSGTTSAQWASLFASYGLFDAAPAAAFGDYLGLMRFGFAMTMR